MLFLTKAVINEAFYYNHDGFSTINAVVYAVTAVMAFIAAFFVYYVQSRSTSERSMFAQLMKGPVFGVCVAGFVASMAVWAFWAKRLELGALPYIVLVGALITFVLCIALPRPEADPWRGDRKPVEGKETMLLALLALTGVTFAYMRGTLRTDRLWPLSPAYLSFVVSAFFLGLFFTYCSSLMYRTVLKVDAGPEIRMGLYGGAALVLVGLFAISTQIAGVLIPFVTGRSQAYTAGAVDPGAVKSSLRTKQMTRIAMVAAVLVPAALVFLFRSSMVVEESTPDLAAEWGRVGMGVLFGLPAICLLAMAGLQFSGIAPSLFGLVASIVLAVAVYLAGVGGIPWNLVTVGFGFLLLILLSLSYLLSMASFPPMTIAVLVALSFVATKVVGRAGIVRLRGDGQQEISDAARFLVLCLPILVFTGVWFIRSWRTGCGYAVPTLFFLFSAFYIFVFYPTASDPRPDTFLNGQDIWTNLGVDFVVVLCIMILFSSIGGFVSDRNFSRVNGLGLYLVYALLGFGGAFLYHTFQANPDFQALSLRLQQSAAGVYDLMSEDVAKAANWPKLTW